MPHLQSPTLAPYAFMQSQAYLKLNSLAKTPLDLSREGNLTAERLLGFTAEGCGLKLLYGTERITEETLEALVNLAEEAKVHKKMEKMQSGEIIDFIKNYPSDNRPVLHTATRDFFDSPNKAEKAVEAANLAYRECKKLKHFIDTIDRENRFTDLIVIGIGGSELGPKAHYSSLIHRLKPGRNVHFVCNLDPDNTSITLRSINLQKTLVLAISKSGSTLETVTNDAFLRARFEKAGLKPQDHFLAVTMEGTPMDDASKYLEIFYLWDWVGGRFSTSSMGGGVLLSFAFGFDVYWEFLQGANAMDKLALSKEIDKNLPLLSALIGVWNRNFLNIPALAVVPYSSALSHYPAHIQQVDMESNGKHIDQLGNFISYQTGPLVFGEPGPNAQHSFFQSIHQGSTTTALEFIGFKEPQNQEDFLLNNTTSQEKLLANMFAQSIALATGQKSDNPNKDFQGNRPNHLLIGKQLTPYILGALLAYYEHKIAFQGFVWGINSFDQEGVQLGKSLASKIIKRMSSSRQGTDKEAHFPLGDAYLTCLKNI